MPLSSELHNLVVGPANPDGKTFGSSASDPIGFFGATPVAQPSGAGEIAVAANASAQALTLYTSTQSPTSVAANSVAEQNITVTGVLATDLVIINKPTSDAGLGLVASRVGSANTIAAAFINATVGVLTPTGSQAYVIATVPTSAQLTASLTPASVAASATAEQQFTITGLVPGMITQVNKPSTNAGIAVLSSRVIASNTLGITFANATAGVLTPTAAETYEVVAFNSLAAASQIIEFGVTATITGITANSTAEQIVTAAGIAATDVVIGVQKPTLTAGLGVVGARVSAANSLGLAFANVTAGVLTPSASQVYGVTLFRPSPAAPMTVYSPTATLTPTSVAANTTAEQTFTVTGLVSGQPTAAQPNFNIASQTGLGIAGVRASATNTLAVTFVNLTAGTLTPAAGTWTVAQFNQAIPTAGNYVQTLVDAGTNGSVTLLNSLRANLVTLGLIAGA